MAIDPYIPLMVSPNVVALAVEWLISLWNPYFTDDHEMWRFRVYVVKVCLARYCTQPIFLFIIQEKNEATNFIYLLIYVLKHEIQGTLAFRKGLYTNKL